MQIKKVRFELKKSKTRKEKGKITGTFKDQKILIKDQTEGATIDRYPKLVNSKNYQKGIFETRYSKSSNIGMIYFVRKM